MKPTHEHCLRPGCGRRLYSTVSRARGYGWGCWAKIRKARRLGALAEFSARQIEQARELIEDAAIIPTAMAAVARTVSSDGLRVYLTTRNGCTCPASKACFHRAAVLMVTA
jgi:hypothetical protein